MRETLGASLVAPDVFSLTSAPGRWVKQCSAGARIGENARAAGLCCSDGGGAFGFVFRDLFRDRAVGKRGCASLDAAATGAQADGS